MAGRMVFINLVLCIWLACCTPAPPGRETAPPLPATTAGLETNTRRHCLEILEHVTELESRDMLVLDSRRMGVNNRFSDFDTYFMDMASGSRAQVTKPGENLDDFSVSPDNRWIAYHYFLLDQKDNYLNNNLVVADSNNRIQKTFQWEDTWGPLNWLNAQHLMIQIIKPGKEGKEYSFLELDPFTNEREYFKPDLPGMYDVVPRLNWDGWGVTAYDPSRTRVAYLQGEVSGPYHYVLWDLEQQEPVTGIQVIGQFHVVPRWSPDGETFAFAPSLYAVLEAYPHYEILGVDREGTITQLTNLTDQYPWVYISDLTWSPDGDSIAFWYSYWQDEKPGIYATGTRYLAVVDIADGLVTDFCIPGEKDASMGVSKYPRPMWSPDGNQIVVQSQITEDAFRTVLVDLRQERAFQIAEDLEPVGWLRSP